MQYGHFDDRAREYVITRPDTPAPWVNYLGSPEYGAIISNNAGGYSFARSGANGRILRYVFNQFDQPGRYLYLRDDDSGDFWSASWQPVGKDLAHYRSRCCHGMGYTRMLADYAGISSEATYYVPDGCAYEVWALRVTNTGPTPRRLTLTGYAEFTNHSNYEQDQVNLQYSLFISRTVFAGNRLTQQIHGNLDAPYGAVLMDPPYHAHAFDGALAVIYNPGTKENAGIFSQTQGWLILAEALRGQGQRAYTYFAENAPAAQNDRAEVRHLEPYCYGQFTEGPASKHFGRSQVHWLTGTASTVMVGCVEGILGLRPDLDGLRLAPAIPREWTGFTMDKDFRGCRLHIRVENPHHRESGFTSLTVNGRELPDACIPAALLTRETEVCLIL